MRTNGFQDFARILRRIETEEDDVSAGIDKGFDPGQRIGDHEMDFKGQARVFAQRFHQIREKEQVLHVMAIGYVEVETFRVRLDPFDFCFEVRQVSRPERGGAF